MGFTAQEIFYRMLLSKLMTDAFIATKYKIDVYGQEALVVRGSNLNS